jgi:hypothetical protein
MVSALSVAGIGPNVAVSVVIAIIGAGPAITTGIGAGNRVRAEKAALIGRLCPFLPWKQTYAGYDGAFRQPIWWNG